MDQLLDTDGHLFGCQRRKDHGGPHAEGITYDDGAASSVTFWVLGDDKMLKDAFDRLVPEGTF